MVPNKYQRIFDYEIYFQFVVDINIDTIFFNIKLVKFEKLNFVSNLALYFF